MGEKTGFICFSAGEQWEEAYQAALDFCERGSGTVLLGPQIGTSGEAWLQKKLLERQELLFGNRLLPWREFVKNRARTVRLSQGQGFTTFQQASLRSFAKKLLRTLEESGAFTHIGGIWQEKRFFAGFLRCLDEARMAGFTNKETLERAFDRLKKADDPIYREVYQDFEFALLGFEAALQSQEDIFDFPRMLQTALEWQEEEKEIFCLGFDAFSLLEVDLLQALAKRTKVLLPLAIDEERGKVLFEQKVEPQDLTEASLLALLNGFSGNRQWLSGGSTAGSGATANSTISQNDPVVFAAHSPLAEAITVARWAEEHLTANRPVRLIANPNFKQNFSAHFRFAKLENAGTLKTHALAQTFFHCLRLKERDFPVSYVVEFAAFLQTATGKFQNISQLAAELGIRRGLKNWRRLGEQAREAEFVNILETLDSIFPAEGTAKDFQEALTGFVQILQLGEVAQKSFRLGEDTGVHGVIAAVLRFSQMLVTSVDGPLSFAEWLEELELLMEATPLGEEKVFSELEVYQYGEWIPPARGDSQIMAVGFVSDVLKSRAFQFYLEEGARRRLAEFLFPSREWDEQQFLRYCQKLLKFGARFSCSHLDSVGKELKPISAVPLMGFTVKEWPEVSLENRAENNLSAKHSAAIAPPKEEVFIDLGEEKKLSASLLEQYKECPFKAFAQKVLRLEDGAHSPSLDVAPLDLGSLLHRILELFYAKYEGKKGGLAKLEENLKSAMEEAVSEVTLRFFKGGKFLWNLQLLRMKEQLLEFLRMDLEFYSQFPVFQSAEFEKKLAGKIGGIPWSGKADRVDYDPEQKRFLVMDYKSGATLPATKDIDDLHLFQIPLYVDALQKETGFEAIGGLYVSLKTGKRNQGLVQKRFNRLKKSEESNLPTYFELHARSGCLKEDEEFTEILANSLQEMETLAAKIQKGEFPVRPLDESSCKNCEVRPACRIRSIESAEKAFSPRNPSLVAFVAEATEGVENEKKEKKFNEEQRQAFAKEDELVFIEASAGTGKTTVIVEKIQRFLAKQLTAGLTPIKAAEKFLAISFTEKSTEELSLRLTKSLTESGGNTLAVLAKHQISTIHGFCKKVISEFPLEANTPPLAELMGERDKEILLEECLELFFTEPHENRKKSLSVVLEYFERSVVEKMLRTLLEKRLLWRAEIAQRKASLADPQRFAAAKKEDQLLFLLLELYEELFALYSEQKRQEQKMDFNDLEAGALQALQQESIALHYQKKLDLVLVDEFQDTNSVQRAILEKIARKNWSNFFVVGDAKQSIYRFRAADVSVFQSLREEAERTGSLISLFRNYRSRKELVETSNQLSSFLFPKPGEGKSFEAFFSVAEASRETGGASTDLLYDLPEKAKASERRTLEAKKVAALVKEKIQAGVEPAEVAILLRKISGNEAFLQALAEEKIPFRVGSSKGFYSQPVILDALALLRALYFPFHSLSVFALLRSPFVAAEDQWIYQRVRATKLENLFSLVEEKSVALKELRQKLPFQTLRQTLVEALKIYPYIQREAYQLEKLLAILQSLEEQGFPKLEIIERVSNWAGWAEEEDSEDDSTMPEPSTHGAVSVMSIHSSKGLEFDLTILPDLTSAIKSSSLPLRGIPGRGLALQIDDVKNPDFEELKDLEKQMEIAETKRLFYVAFTRAKEENIFLRPKSEGKLGERWSDYLQLAKVESQGQKSWRRPEVVGSGLHVPAKISSKSIFPDFSTSISEIAANQFCPEFHRRKFVARWDDLVVNLLPKPVAHLKKPKHRTFTPTRAAQLLRKLHLENKERGIALHRVLERVGLEKEDRALWLRESYVNQGAPPTDPLLDELIAEDLAMLEKFLQSPAGREFFDPQYQSFPELSFRWRLGEAALFGTIDRLVKKSDREWMVVDYKSSLLEDSVDRYRFQVESYMCAIRAYAMGAHANGSGAGEPMITGYLVDLSTSNMVNVPFDPAQALKNLEKEMWRVAENYRLQENVFDLHGRGIRAEEHCFSCAYSLHCDLGSKFVLAFQ
jgi:ATP-dependent exoDNAse (exonuclease V) beta subunit